MLLVIQCCCSLALLAHTSFLRSSSRVSRIMDQCKVPTRFRWINERSDSPFQSQIRNLPKATRIKEAASCPLWLSPPHRKLSLPLNHVFRGSIFILCTATRSQHRQNAVTSQSSLELSWRKMLVMLENCRTYINHSLLKQLSVSTAALFPVYRYNQK
jgi:hypothetical protein